MPVYGENACEIGRLHFPRAPVSPFAPCRRQPYTLAILNGMGRTSRGTSAEQPLLTPARALSFDERAWARSTDEVADEVVARLVRRRLSMERMKPWVVLALLVLPLVVALYLGLHFDSEVVLAAAAAMAATFGIGLTFYVEHAFLELFMAEGKVLGLSEDACRRVFQRATSASRLLDVMESCGKEPSDAELASFVR